MRGIRYGEGVIGQGFATILWGLVYITSLVGKCGACEEVADRDGFFVIAKGIVQRVGD